MKQIRFWVLGVVGVLFVLTAGCEDSSDVEEPDGDSDTGTGSSVDSDPGDTDSIAGLSCQGVVCTFPPDGSCDEFGGLQVSSPLGWCDGGQCFYSEFSEDCTPGACEGGSCTHAPCQGVTCSRPPEPRCSDANSISAFNPIGFCAVRWDDAECVYASNEMDCDNGCQDGGCIEEPCAGVTCTLSPARFCIGDQLLVYDVLGGCEMGGCRYESQLVDCGQSGCASGGCVGMDPCVYTQCLLPPAAYCVDSQTLRAYQPQGLCDDGDCHYTPNDIQCSSKCQNGQCANDPCAGVECATPPAPSCQDEDTLRHWSGTSSCTKGVCDYDVALAECVAGCENGKCLDDPCSGVSCLLPPPSYCAGDTLVTFPAQGTCNSQGQCEYESNQQQCPDGCVLGQCLDDPCAGADAPPVTTVVVEPVYSGAPDWNDYVENNGDSVYTATGLACNGDNTIDGGTGDGQLTGGSDCINGGLFKKVDLPSESSCATLSYKDELDAMVWNCDDSGANVVLYSRGLKALSGLASLVNDSAFKENRILVTKNGETCPAYVSDGTIPWWSNPVQPLPDNSNWMIDRNIILDVPGTIYTLPADRDSEGYIIAAEKISLVTLGEATLRYAGSGNFNCNLGDGMDTTPDQICLVSVANTGSYAWIEGRFDGYNKPVKLNAVLVVGSAFTRGNNLTIRNAEVGLRLQQSLNGRYSGLRIDHQKDGVYLDGAMYNRIWDGTISNCDSAAVIHKEAGATNISGVTMVSSLWGIYLHKQGVALKVTNATVGNVTRGISSIGEESQLAMTVQNLLLANFDWGIELQVSMLSTFGQLALADGITGIYLGDGISSSKFTGNLLTGNITTACNISGTLVDPPLDVSCNPLGLSDQSLRTISGFSSTFEGSIGTPGDAVNTTDANGQAAYSMWLDWNGFENSSRAWSSAAAPYPDSLLRGPCMVDNCHIWDWRPKADDVVVRNRTGDGITENGAFVPGAQCPAEIHGDATTANQIAVPEVYLTNAVEIMGDYFGDDDGLCESNEHCLYSPHFGSYQGEGSLSTCEYDDGIVGPGGTTAVVDVTMLGYSS